MRGEGLNSCWLPKNGKRGFTFPLQRILAGGDPEEERSDERDRLHRAAHPVRGGTKATGRGPITGREQHNSKRQEW